MLLIFLALIFGTILLITWVLDRKRRGFYADRDGSDAPAPVMPSERMGRGFGKRTCMQNAGLMLRVRAKHLMNGGQTLNHLDHDIAIERNLNRVRSA